MDYSELLNDFLDNSLSNAEEETLFQALSSDHELRFEMKYLLGLRQAVQNDEKAYALPVSSVNSVFARLGYTAPAAATATGGALLGWKSGFMNALQSYSTLAVSAIVGAVVASSVFLAVDGGSDNPADIAAEENFNAVPMEALMETPREIPVSQAFASPVSGDQSIASVQSPSTPPTAMAAGASAGLGQKALHQSNEAIVDQSDLSAIEQHEFANADVRDRIADARFASANHLIAGSDNGYDIGVPSYSDHRSELSDLYPKYYSFSPAFELRSILSFSIPEPDVPTSGSGPQNFALSYRFPTNNTSAFVLEVGRESYYQEFTEQITRGGELLHKQNPTLLWGGGGYRMSIAPNSEFDPFGQILLGFSEGGIIPRLMFGSHYAMSEGTRMTFGLEASALVYRLQGRSFFSPKIGLTYGISFSL